MWSADVLVFPFVVLSWAIVYFDFVTWQIDICNVHLIRVYRSVCSILEWQKVFCLRITFSGTQMWKPGLRVLEVCNCVIGVRH